MDDGEMLFRESPATHPQPEAQDDARPIGRDLPVCIGTLIDEAGC